jgi:hypothetical protein
MEEKAGRGRPSGESTSILIKDPSMEPFYITKDNYNFTVYESVKSKKGFAGKEASGKINERVVGYYTGFKFALKAVAREKLGRKHKSYPTILEYINEYREIENNINQMLKNVEI